MRRKAVQNGNGAPPRVSNHPGIAWTEGRLYLVVATRAADYEHIAKLIHCRTLVRDDPDYAEHHGQRFGTSPGGITSA